MQFILFIKIQIKYEIITYIDSNLIESKLIKKQMKF